MEIEVFKDGRPCGKKTIPDDIYDAALRLIAFMSEQGVTQFLGLSLGVPALTPAQQHAEELAKYARIMFDFIESPATAFYREYREAVTALLAAVEPPEPPTLAEALAALVEVEQGNASASPDAIYAVKTILDRARRSGVL